MPAHGSTHNAHFQGGRFCLFKMHRIVTQISWPSLPCLLFGIQLADTSLFWTWVIRTETPTAECKCRDKNLLHDFHPFIGLCHLNLRIWFYVSVSTGPCVHFRQIFNSHVLLKDLLMCVYKMKIGWLLHCPEQHVNTTAACWFTASKQHPSWGKSMMKIFGNIRVKRLRG